MVLQAVTGRAAQEDGSSAGVSPVYSRPVLRVWTGGSLQRWQAFKLAVPSGGGGGGLGLGGGIVADVSCPWGGRGGHRVCLMTDEWIGDLSLPPFLTPPFSDMCQSAPGQYGDLALLPSRHVLPRQGLAALRGTVHQHESFSPPPPAKCARHEGISETLWINKR